MGKLKVTEVEQRNNYKDISIKYPFCYVTPDKLNYFRYLEDGRYEYINLSENKCTLFFGKRTDSLQHLANDDKFYFKILANINELISNEDFEFKRNWVLHNYNEYLNENKFIALDVEKILENKKNNGIILNDDLDVNF